MAPERGIVYYIRINKKRQSKGERITAGHYEAKE
jgi:hypothetical protein